MSEAKPVNTSSVSKDSVVSMNHEDTYLELVIKTEEVDLEPDCIKCETDEETDYSNFLVDNTYHNSIQMTDDTYNKDIEERSGLVTDMGVHIKTETSYISPQYNDESQVYIEISGVKLEVEKNDEISADEIPEDLNTEIKMEQIHKSDTDITVGDEVCYTDNISIQFSPKSDITKSKNAQNEKPFSCDICSYKSADRGNLRRHVRTHTGTKPFSCEICGYKSAYKTHLKRHSITHTGTKPFSCSVCSFKSAYQSHLKRHMSTHTGTKPFSCAFCSYKSARKGDLEEHTRTHTGTKPFSCSVCGHKSARKGDLTKHMRTHTGAKPS